MILLLLESAVNRIAKKLLSSPKSNKLGKYMLTAFIVRKNTKRMRLNVVRIPSRVICFVQWS